MPSPSTGSGPARPADVTEPGAHLGRRLGALVIDWVIASLISAGFFQYHPMATLAVFGAMTFLLLATLGATIGHRLFGLRVYRMATGTAPIGPVQSLIRTACLLLLVPVAVAGADGRGLHDTWAGTFIDRFAARATPPSAPSGPRSGPSASSRG